MHPLLQAFLDSYQGGICTYTQNDCLYRGEIALLEASEPHENNFTLKVLLAWNTTEISPPLVVPFVDEGIPQGTNDWREVTILEHICLLDVASMRPLTKATSTLTIDKGRLFIQHSTTKERTIIQPPADSLQPLYRITWLPNGPKAKRDAAEGCIRYQREDSR